MPSGALWALIPAAVVLSPPVTIAWMYLARRVAWGRARRPTPGWSIRWPVLVCAAYPLCWYLTVARRLLPRFLPFDEIWVAVGTWWILPSLVLSAAIALWSRSWIAASGAAVAGPVSVFAFVWFERGTHGPWYIQSEAVALWAATVVGAAAWQLAAGGGLFTWAMLARRRRLRDRGHCARCGYPLIGLPAPVCPECGETSPA